MTAELWIAATSLVLLVLVFVPLERVFPARPGQPARRPELGIDLAFYLGQYLVFAGVAVTVLGSVHATLLPLSLGTWSGGLPLWTQVALALVFGVAFGVAFGAGAGAGAGAGTGAALGAVVSGAVEVRIAETMPLLDAERALALSQAGRMTGKIVLVP